jgi:glycosyltransferase involved in cell wall biosynthesis
VANPRNKLTKPLKILLITSGQPALNPRLVKEADALTEFGYDVTVLYSYWNKWGTNFDKQLLAAKKWKAVCVGGDPVYNKLIFFASRIIHRFAGQLYRVGIRWFADWAIARSSFFLVREARKYAADLYIGHNLGSLPAVVKTAQLYNKPCGFDAEDFHRNEVTDDPLNKDVLLKTYLEDKYIPHLNFITASSPLIAAEYQKLYPQVKKEVVLNVFPANSDLNVEEMPGNKAIKLFWFSQTIGANRGIEDAIKALNTLNESSFELHLLGDVSENIKILFTGRLKNKSGLFFHEPIAPDHIIEFASQFDIGLALENKIPFNRDICLTNKIFSYIQSGLAVIASDTKAQTGLLKRYPSIGKLYTTGNAQSLADILSYYQLNRDNLFKTRNASLQASLEQLNWEIESKKLLSVTNLVI